MLHVNKLPFATLSVAAVIFFSLWLASKFFIINISSSMPKGLYWIDGQNHSSRDPLVFNKGDIVAVCLNKANRDLGLKRDYILASNKCQNSEPLIKSIFAIPGDNVILKMNDITLNRKVFHYPTLLIDSKGRPLHTFPRGSYLKTSGYWLIGTNDKKSWDSRYWGPVDVSQILFRLTPLLTFK